MAETFVRRFHWILGALKFYYIYQEQTKHKWGWKNGYYLYIWDFVFSGRVYKNMHSKIFIEIWPPNKCFKVRFCLRKIPWDLFLVPSHMTEKGSGQTRLAPDVCQPPHRPFSLPRCVPASPRTCQPPHGPSSLMGSLSMMVFRVLAEGRGSELI